MGYANPILIGAGASQQSVYEVVTEARHPRGTVGFLPDGRRFEYVRSQNATAIGHGKLASYEPITADYDKLVCAAAAVGDTSITVTTTGSGTLTVDELVGASLNVDDDAGEGQLYKIIGNPVLTSAGAVALTIDRPVVTALTTSSTATIVAGPTAVKISATVTAQADPVEVAAGVPLVDIPAGSTTNQYFWVQKSGLASVLFGTAVGSVGEAVYQGEDAGSFQVLTMDHADTTDRNEKVVLGTIAALLPVEAEYHPVVLDIA